MSISPTLILTDDDDRTMVDRDVPQMGLVAEPDEERACQLMGPFETLLRAGWRPWVAVLVVAAFCGSLLAVALSQRHLSARLQETVDALQRTGQALSPRETTAVLVPHESQVSALTTDRIRVTDLQPATREQLELEAATRVIANDYRGALDSYLSLAAYSPDEQVFSNLVAILRAKLACGVEGSRCD